MVIQNCYIVVQIITSYVKLVMKDRPMRTDQRERSIDIYVDKTLKKDCM